MDTTQIFDITRRAIFIAAEVSAPILIICLAVGIVISIFQAATQIHEQTLSFVPKIIIVLAVIIIGGSWMVNQISDFTKEVFDTIASL
jgi:flagellar biosynthetic protein FliQ